MQFKPFNTPISSLNVHKAVKGKVLLAEPFMEDPFFKRAVVLLVENNSDGTVGFILNNPLDLNINDLLVDFPSFETTVGLGGPVQERQLFYVHTYGKELPGSEHIHQDIYWNGDYEVLKKLAEEGKIDPEKIRFFLGYSGWEKGQLEMELIDNAWLIEDISLEMLFNSPKNLWREILKNGNKDIAIFSNFPEDPNSN